MTDDVTNDALLPLREVVRISGISRSEIWRRCKSGAFPQPTRDLGPHCTRWSQSEVQAWVRARLAARSKSGAEVATTASA